MEKKAAMKNPESFAIGIDVGGTTVKGGIVNAAGEIVRRIALDARGTEGPEVVIGVIHSVITQLLEGKKHENCLGIGIGCPGVVGLDGDSVSHPPNLHDWHDVKLASALKKKIALPIRVENDANVAALAEARFGAGKQFKDFLFVIWGTGVGGGIIYDHEIFHGPNGGAGELGHLSINYEGPQCNCGNRGCIESYIGQRYLSMRTKSLLDRYPDSVIKELVGGDLDKIEPAIVAAASEKGDTAAIEILREAGTLLGYALASAMNLLDLRVAVIGGGISAAPEFVYDAMTSGLHDRILRTHKPYVQALRAKLGNAAGIIGAAAMMM
jgi:glucokinase